MSEEKRNLYFSNMYGENHLIKKSITEEESLSLIRKFCDEREFKVYYIRIWNTSIRCKKFDVGSHCEFFFWTDCAHDTVEN